MKVIKNKNAHQVSKRTMTSTKVEIITVACVTFVVLLVLAVVLLSKSVRN